MKYLRMNSLVVLILSSLVFGGCHRVSYDKVEPLIVASGSRKIVVVTHDQRDEVMSGEKESNYIGVIQSGFDDPFYITTGSGDSLAEDMTTSIANAFGEKGFKTSSAAVSPEDNHEDIPEKLEMSRGERLLLLTINDWQSSTDTKTSLMFNLTLEVFDENGEKLATVNTSGYEKKLVRDSWDPADRALKELPKAYRRSMEKLLNNIDIISALR